MRNPKLDRRRLLKIAAGLPIVAGLISFLSPLLRFIKPNVDPFAILEPTVHDLPTGAPVAAAALSELKKPWEFKYFVYTQTYPQYTAEGYKTAAVPGVVIRLPRKIELPWAWVMNSGQEPQFIESDIIAFSRICPHLGCIYNYVPDWREVTAGYGGYVPPEQRQHSLMACPCHLSIFDPADLSMPGRVLSGPAPRPPRTFFYTIEGDMIVARLVEPGGIA